MKYRKPLGLLRSLALIWIAGLVVSCQSGKGNESEFSLDSISLGDQVCFDFALDKEDSTHISSIDTRYMLETSIHFVYPKGNDKLLQGLANVVFYPKADISDLNKLLKDHQERVLEEYGFEPSLRFTPIAGEEPDGTHRMYDSVACHFIYEDKHFASFQVSKSSFSGGAHESILYALHSFDKQTGALLNDGYLFEETALPALSDLLRKGLREFYGLQDGESLSDVLLVNEEEIAPNNNFMLTESGIRYCYNIYEIAPYSNGTIFIDLKWEEIEHLLREEFISKRA